MKTFIKIFLSFVIAISPIFLINSANAAVGGWSLGGGVAQGASTVYEGTKKVVIDGVDYIKKGTAKITPPASGVAKVLARGAAGYALSVAVEQLLGSVDWVLDPANNQIVYTKPNEKDPTQFQKIWIIVGCGTVSQCIQRNDIATTPDSACALSASKRGEKLDEVIFVSPTVSSCTFVGTSSTQYVRLELNPIYNPDVEQEQKTLPLDVVAQQVISNAESGDTNAQAATTAAAADIVAEAEKDDAKARPIVNQLEQSASTENADADAQADANTATGSQTQNPSKPDTTDLKLEFPAFCGWAPVVCEAAQVVISFPQTLTNWWETGKSKAEEWALSISEAWISFRDWFKSDDHLPDDEKPQISEISTPELKEDAIRWSAQCPADAQVPINMQGVSSTITFSWSPWCQLLDMIKPAIIASAYIGAAFIVLGLRT